MADEFIKIHHADTDAEAKERHQRIVDRLTALGPVEARAMLARDAFPTQWHPIISVWLKDK